jgi:hypothetical protein
MDKIIYPITWLAGREGKAPDVIHDIAVEMMEHRADLLRNATRVDKAEARFFRKQSRLLEEYATVLDAIYYQLEPEQWDPDTSGNFIELAHAHNIALPDWMVANRMQQGKTQNDDLTKETIEEAVGRFDNEGGRI